MGLKKNNDTGSAYISKYISARMLGGAMGVVLAMSGSAWAQLDEVVVTAERRVSNLQDVPVAVTALTSEEIDRADIHDPASLQFKVPNFTFSAFSPGQSIFSLRGVSSNDDGAGTENSVAVFLDDVYFGRISNAAFDFFDVEQVEVLRGPQGTLWGKNAIGGTINIRSKKPSRDGWTTRGKIDLGEYNLQNIGAYVTGPLSDNVAIKASLNSRNRDGFVANALDTKNQDGEGNLLDENNSNWRTQVIWDLNDQTELLLTAARQTNDNNDIGRMPIENQNPANARTTGNYQNFLNAGGSFDDLRSANPITGFSRGDSETYSVKLTTEVVGGELTYIFATYKTLADWEMDSVGAGKTATALIDDIFDETKATSHELRWAGNLSDNFSLVAGTFILEEETDRTEQFNFIRSGDDRDPQLNVTGNCTWRGTPDDNPTKDCVDYYRQVNDTESTALFAHADWRFISDWTLSAGARWTEDEKSITSFSRNGGFAIINGNLPEEGVSDSAGWDDISPKVALNYTPDDNTLLYASWASGFKSGGFGAAPASVDDAMNLELEPEEAINIEFGFKTELLDNTLRVNGALFQTDYESLQYQRFGALLTCRAAANDGNRVVAESFAGNCQHGIKTVGGFGQFRSINSGDAEISGVELELTHAPMPNFTWNAAIGLLDTEQEVNFREYFAVDPGQDIIVTRELNRAPETQYSLGFVWDIPVQAGVWTLSADYSHSDEVRADVVDEFAKEDERQLLDARLAYAPTDGNYKFILWGKNITDERYFSHVYTVGDGVIGKVGDPAVFGASLAWEFN